jgi:hypothetical protein
MTAGFLKLCDTRGDDRERLGPSKPSLMTVYPPAIASCEQAQTWQMIIDCHVDLPAGRIHKPHLQSLLNEHIHDKSRFLQLP